jgi:hypothetical protein
MKEMCQNGQRKAESGKQKAENRREKEGRKNLY